MIVVVAGMYRSGSTFCLNVVKELLTPTGKVVLTADNSFDGIRQIYPEQMHLIIKTHSPDVQLTAMIRKHICLCVCSFRKPEDAIASWVRTFGGEIDQAIDMFEVWLQWHSSNTGYVRNIQYEDIDTNPIGVILQLQHYIYGVHNLDLAREISQKLSKVVLKARYDELDRSGNTTDIGFSYYDNDTFFHRRHISSIEPILGMQELSASMVDYIRKRFAPYCDSNGNYLSMPNEDPVV